ncbi:hypothetical protein ACFQY7_05765 [Actinomadura luteofluorescens]|uniref:hypothetical protein n=1 Tax=Actinomadura luteofluorescens TaxID=46163 RepID=UPI00362CDB4B
MEQALPLLPRTGGPRRDGSRRPRPADRVRRPAVLGGLQRHLPAGRGDAHRPGRHALPHSPGGGGRTAGGWLRVRQRGASPPVVPTGFAFAELAAPSAGPVGEVLGALGFVRGGRHTGKPVELWEQGAARILVNSGSAEGQDGRRSAPSGWRRPTRPRRSSAPRRSWRPSCPGCAVLRTRPWTPSPLRTGPRCSSAVRPGRTIRAGPTTSRRTAVPPVRRRARSHI